MASSSSKHNKSHHVGSKSVETDEIVRYMSNLPSYLERGKPVQDRALTFGVLDWGRLEQWQYHHHKPSVTTTSSNSPSGSTSSEKKTANRSRTEPRSIKKNDFHPQDFVESRSSDDTGSFQTSSSSSSSRGKMKIEYELENEIGKFQGSCLDPKTHCSNSLQLKNKTVNRKNSADFKTTDSKDSDFKTVGKNLFSFSLSSKFAATKSSPRPLESPPASQNQPDDSKVKAKVKMDLGNCKEIRVDGSCMNKSNESSSSSLESSSSSSSRKQALFQMAVRNGRPLFTFSVNDNKNELLAATVRSLSTKDDKSMWVYTFFTIHEVKKKKSGWVFRSTKDNGNGYLSNVSAQMTVSNSKGKSMGREFVLASVDSGQTDPEALDAELEHELAAIIVQFLDKAGESEDGDRFSMTVVLPGGHHSVPRKGEPSPLIERWRSGGRCDCGGWDVGCRLKTLSNKVQSGRRSDSHESFDLFFQGDVINERPFFSLSPMKDGVFSVNYNGSLPLLQAFSVCISVIECRKSSRHTELKTYVAKQVDDDVAPVTYASLPPVSPVGRA